ncbi:MAG: NAD(+)/NADH kinase [Treponema sp.]|jgi:NAD+ kinase|nr:NAD(+)/NADH kinase [Treponema sp.]
MAGKRRALLVINQNKNAALDLSAGISAVLEKRSYETLSFSFDGKPSFALQGINFDLGMSLGGDGTVLFAARAMAPLGVPIMPVNLGTLGFIAAVPPEKWEEAFDAWEGGRAAVSRRLMLEVSVERNGKTAFERSCLNDAVISASGIAKLIRLDVKTETAGGKCIDLGRFRSDGLIVATPTGSTGYSVAAGGPIVDPEMEMVIINPICPFTLSNRPIVVPSDERVIALVEADQRSAVLLTLDGQITEPLEQGDRIIIRQAPYKALLVASNREMFYEALRTKLGWSGGTVHAGYDGGSDA